MRGTRTGLSINQEMETMMDKLSIPRSMGRATRAGLAPVFAGALLLLAACTSVPPAPAQQLAVSTAAVEQAVSAGAPELAPTEYRAAREKLDRAQAAMTTRDYAQAQMLAEQAQADAQLAITKTRAAKAQKAAASLEEDSRVLREEINRKAR